jgi:mannitol-1-phosphate 5-dehydrogenase
MVPMMTSSDLEKDPLMVFAEPYNTLIVDAKAFKSGIPDVKGLAPKENIKAWVDRKAFIHNLGHATAAYFGSFRHPEATYLYEILKDEEVLRFTKETMKQAAASLQVAYPGDFKDGDLDDHIADLLYRFQNKALKDTIFRVGHDLVRKLGADDRFIGAVHLAMENGMPYNKILESASYAFSFSAKDENGHYFQPDVEFKESLAANFERTMTEKLGLDRTSDSSIISELKLLFAAR